MKNNINILIVDDHKIIIDGIQALMSEFPEIKVKATAESSAMAIRLIQNQHQEFDIVLMDIQMPEKDGIDTTKEIKTRFPDLKVIAVSMAYESYYIKKMLDAGADGYVLKTSGKSVLYNAIVSVSKGEKFFDANVMDELMKNFSNKLSDNPVILLTKREKEVLSLISKGLTDKEIAENLFISVLTVITHRKNLLSKLGLKNKVELTRYAIENSLCD